MAKIAVVMLTIPDGMDATLFDNFPTDSLFAKEVLDTEDFLDREKMEDIGRGLGRCFYNSAKFDKQDKEKAHSAIESLSGLGDR